MSGQQRKSATASGTAAIRGAESIVDNPAYMNSKLLQYLADRITNERRKFGRYLGLEEHKINIIEEDYTSVTDRSFKILETWKYANGKPDLNTTYVELCEALHSVGRNDLVDYVKKEAWKKSGSADHTLTSEKECHLQAEIKRLIEEKKRLEQQFEEKLNVLNQQLGEARKEGQFMEMKRKLEEEAKKTEHFQHTNEELKKANEGIKRAKEAELRLMEEKLKMVKQETKDCKMKTTAEISRLMKEFDGARKDFETFQHRSEVDDKLNKQKAEKCLHVLVQMKEVKHPELWHDVAAHMTDGWCFLHKVLSPDTVPDLTYFLSSGHANKLTMLRLQDCHIAAKGFQSLAAALLQMASLENLDLTGNTVTVDVAATLAESLSHLTVRNIELIWCHIDNEAGEVIARGFVAGPGQKHWLGMDGNHLTEDGARRVRAITGVRVTDVRLDYQQPPSQEMKCHVAGCSHYQRQK